MVGNPLLICAQSSSQGFIYTARLAKFHFQDDKTYCTLSDYDRLAVMLRHTRHEKVALTCQDKRIKCGILSVKVRN